MSITYHCDVCGREEDSPGYLSKLSIKSRDKELSRMEHVCPQCRVQILRAMSDKAAGLRKGQQALQALQDESDMHCCLDFAGSEMAGLVEFSPVSGCWMIQCAVKGAIGVRSLGKIVYCPFCGQVLMGREEMVAARQEKSVSQPTDEERQIKAAAEVQHDYDYAPLRLPFFKWDGHDCELLTPIDSAPHSYVASMYKSSPEVKMWYVDDKSIEPLLDVMEEVKRQGHDVLRIGMTHALVNALGVEVRR